MSEELRELQVLVDQAELAAASGDPRTALITADRALVRLGDAEPADLRRAARRVKASAFEGIGDFGAAIAELEDLVRTPYADAAWLKDLVALSRCHRDTGDFARAIAVGEDAVPVIAGLGIDGMTEAIQLTVTVAAAYLTRGDVAHARRLCKRAVETAEKHGSALGKASAYWNASIIEAECGDPDAALDLARLSMTEFERGDDARNLGRIRGLIADLLLKLDPPDVAEALATLDQADREIAWAPHAALDISRQHLTRAEAFFLLDEYADATEHLRLCIESAPADVPGLRASVLVVEGKIAAAEGRTDDARQAYQAATQVLTSVGADRPAAQLWLDLGNLLSDIGETDAAHDAFRRAAASNNLRPEFGRFTADH